MTSVHAKNPAAARKFYTATLGCIGLPAANYLHLHQD